MINKKQFLGGINTDVTESLIDPKDYIGAMNVRIATSENGLVGNVSNVEGNRALTSTINSSGTVITFAPTGDNTIGTYEDIPNRRIIFFNYSTSNHGIYCYDADTDLIYTVLKSTQVNTGLNFQKDKFIHSVSMVGHMLYWTDDYNEPRRINVESGIKMNHPTYVTDERAYVVDSYGYIDYSIITIIRKPPALPLIIEKSTDAGYVNNFIKDEAFQFFYRFGYKDGESSVFSPKSILAGYNSVTDTFNSIKITVPILQAIEQDVDTVEVGAIYATGGKAYIIKTWKRTVDITVINNHNSKTTALSYTFYNDVVGVNVPDTDTAKSYDSVPIKSAALEVAKERLFLANNISGYASPTATSLTIGLNNSQVTNVTSEFYGIIWNLDYNLVNWVGGRGSYNSIGLLKIENAGSKSGYYSYPTTKESNEEKFPANGSYNITELTFVGATRQAVQNYYNVNQSELTIFGLTIQTGSARSITWNDNPKQTPSKPEKILITIGSLTVSQFSSDSFKSDSTYKFGIIFKDFANRPCGVVTKPTLKLTTPDRTFTTLSNTESITWNLSGTASEIPDWAYSYSIVRTKSLRTNNFIQLRADKLLYIKKLSTTGEYSIIEDTANSGSISAYDKTYFGVAIKATSLYSNGLGYAYQEGDLVKIYKGSLSDATINIAPITLKVKDTFTDHIICELNNFGSINNNSDAFLFEVYTPVSTSLNELYYEVGATYNILNPNTVNRKYSVKSGEIDGDVRFVFRKALSLNYVAEAMSPNDKYFKNWYTDIGRPYIEIDAIVKRKKTEIAYSNVILPGTKTNGLSSFEVLNFINVPLELSSIQRLKLTSKVQSEGTVMIVVGEQETASAYLGEGQIFDASGASFLAKSVNVIGQINVLKGGYGTLHPESVSEWKGTVFFFDVRKGAAIQYDANGLTAISDNGMRKYFRKLGQDYSAYLKNPTVYNNANKLPLRIQSITDPFHEEMIIQTPRMNANVSNEHLQDMIISTQSVSVNTAIEGGFTATATTSVQGGFTATATYSCAIVVTLNTTAPTVAGNNGTTTANVTGGTTNYTYLWSNGATTKTISGLLSGSTYSVTVTDIISACTGTASVSFPALATVNFYSKPYDRSTDTSHTAGYFLKNGVRIDGTHYFSQSFFANPPVGTNGTGNYTLTPLTIKKLAGSTLDLQSNFFIDNPTSEPYPNSWTSGGVTALTADLILQVKKDGVLVSGSPTVTVINPSSPTTTINQSVTMVAGSVYDVYAHIENLVLTPPVPTCPDRRVVFQICNSNSAKDDNFDIYLNNTYIGAVDLNSNSQVGSVFIADTNTSVALGSSDFVCPLNLMVTYRFNPAILLSSNVLEMRNTQNNNNGNAGTIGIRNYLLTGTTLSSPCVITDLTYSGSSGTSFTFNFNYTECCAATP